MKKFLSICLIFYFCNSFAGAKDLMEAEQIDFSEEISVDSLTTLEIDLNVEDLELTYHNDKSIRVDVKGEAPDKNINNYLVFSGDSGKFTLKSIIKGFKRLNRYNLNIKLYLPEKELDNCIITTSTGDVVIDKLHSNITKIKSSTGRGDYGLLIGRVINLTSSTGDKQIKNINCKVANIKSSSGDIEIENIIAERVVLSTSTGNKNISNIQSGETVIKSSTGDTLIEKLSGDIFVDSSSGSVSLVYDEFVHDLIDVHTSTGDIEILLPGQSEFVMNLSSNTGKVKCDFPVKVTGSRSDKTLEGEVTTGDDNVFGHAEVLVTSQTGSINILSGDQE